MPTALDVVREQHARLTADPVVARVLDAFPEGAVVLNRQREIVLANDKIAARLGVPRDELLGLRPGQAFRCVHADELPEGCGTTEFCRYCGANEAQTVCRRTGAPVRRECRITTVAGPGPAALDLEVWGTPLAVGDDTFMVFAIRDTTDEKRRRALERLFFHDLLNAAGGLKGIVDLWGELPSTEAAELGRAARPLVDHLLEEIRAQRDLVAAERGDLRVEATAVEVARVLDEVRALYAHHEVAAGKTLAVRRGDGPDTILTVPALLRRVLGNLVKNALEASGPGDTVTLAYDGADAPRFTVHNPAVMPEAVQRQLFQRSFSTKPGPGRGLGTYSVKLFTEGCLGGRVAFTSTAGAGTTITITLPAAP